ncbi:MAG: hypothetical protein U0359_23185 [Byssovorax sp.]
MTPGPDRLLRLAEKYRTLGALRRARAAGDPLPDRAVFQALADELPGSVAELDTLPLDTIDARAEALARAASGGPIEPWMTWLSGYHALFRAALRIRSRARRERDPDPARAAILALDASTHAGIPVDPDFVRAVCRPPAGRLAAVIFARLEEAHGAPRAVIKQAIFPGSRRG